MMKIQVRSGSCLDYEGKAVLLFHFSDIRPLAGSLALLDWRCNAAVSRLWKRKENLLKYGQLTILATQGKIRAGTAILTGLGPAVAFDGDLRREALRVALRAARDVGAGDVAVDGSNLGEEEGEGIADDLRNALEGLEIREPFTIALFFKAKVRRYRAVGKREVEKEHPDQ